MDQGEKSEYFLCCNQTVVNSYELFHGYINDCMAYRVKHAYMAIPWYYIWTRSDLFQEKFKYFPIKIKISNDRFRLKHSKYIKLR